LVGYGEQNGYIDWRDWGDCGEGYCNPFSCNKCKFDDYDDYDDSEFVGIYFYELLEEGDVPDMACVPFKTDPKKNRGRKDHHRQKKSRLSKKESSHCRSPKRRRVKVSRARLRREILFDRHEMDTDYKDPDPETFDEIDLNKEFREPIVAEETPIKEPIVTEEYHHYPFEQYKVDWKKNRGRKNRHTKAYPKLGFKLKNKKQRNQTNPHKRRRGSSPTEIKRLIDEWIIDEWSHPIQTSKWSDWTPWNGYPRLYPTTMVEERHEFTDWIENLNLKEEKHFDLRLGFLVAKFL
jgi:hypothetical protein